MRNARIRTILRFGLLLHPWLLSTFEQSTLTQRSHSSMPFAPRLPFGSLIRGVGYSEVMLIHLGHYFRPSIDGPAFDGSSEMSRSYQETTSIVTSPSATCIVCSAALRARSIPPASTFQVTKS